MNNFKLLLGQCYIELSAKNVTFRQPIEYYKILKQHYPSLEPWLKEETFKKIESWDQNNSIILDKDAPNIAGKFLKDNISTPCTLIEDPATVENVLAHFEQDDYTHLGLGIFVNSYHKFIEISEAVRKKYKDIKIIAGHVGALFEDTKKYADYICIGDGVSYLRKLFNEKDVPLKYGLVRDRFYIRIKNNSIERDAINFVTKLGCPYNCDFCITNVFFKGKSIDSFITPKEAKDALLTHYKNIGFKEFTTWFSEPTAIISPKWWYELFDLFRDVKGHFPMMIATTAASLKKLDYKKLINSAMRLDTVNIGVENFYRDYNKNKNIDLALLIKQLRTFGIATYASYIIGFPNDSINDMWKGIEKLLNLNATHYEIHNLKVLPETPLWKQLKAENRLINCPPELRYIHGFQAFEGKYIKSGFEEIYPILCKIYYEIERETGPLTGNYYEVLKNLYNIQDYNKKTIGRTMKLYRTISIEMLTHWKIFFKPSKNQIKQFLNKIDYDSKDIPS